MRGLMCLATLALWTVGAAAAESFLVVHVSDMTREDSYQVMSGDEFKQFQKHVQLEERFFAKAVAQVSEEWRKDELNKTTPFPAGRLASRKVIGQPESFPSRDKAEARVSQYEERESNKVARERERQKANAGKTKKSNPDADKEKEQREKEKTIQARRAADLVATKIETLIRGESAGADEKDAPKTGEPKADGVKK